MPIENDTLKNDALNAQRRVKSTYDKPILIEVQTGGTVRTATGPFPDGSCGAPCVPGFEQS